MALFACAAVAAVAASGAVAAPGAAAAAAPAPSPADTIPVSAMNGWSLHGLSPADLNAQLALMQSAGVTLLRVDASWSSIEPNAPALAGPRYSFGTMDAEVADLAAHQIRWLPIVDYSAPWAGSVSGDWRSAPTSNAQFAAFAAAIAARYGADGSFWAQNPQVPYLPVQTYEIWNEENASYYWDNGPDPGAYATLYLAARAAIRAIDPQAQVAIGGLTNPRQGMSALAFLSGMFQAVPGLVGSVDAVGIHPYAANGTGTVQFVVQVRQLLDSVGQSAVPIDVTEFGWQTGSATVEQRRAANMTAVAQALGNSNCGIGLLAPYDWTDPSYITNGDWGLAGSDGVRPAGTAWFTALAGDASGNVNRLCPAVITATGGTSAGGATTSAPPATAPTATAPTAANPSAGGGSSTSTAKPKTKPKTKPKPKPKAKPAAKRKAKQSAQKRSARVGSRRRVHR
jgi:cellulase (glycosyl hydrolase family 5)